MNDHGFDFCGTRLIARAAGTLWWPAAGLLVVSDLHLGKAERWARRRRTMLPPFETAETLARLEAELATTGARRVLLLGDSFDDRRAAAALDADALARLVGLTAGREWLWVEGNHDPGPLDLPDRHLAEHREGPLVFRHIATDAAGEISGHYHPKVRLALKGASISRPCFLIDGRRVVMPAFGTYTGGLCTTAPEISALMDAEAVAVLTGPSARAVPMPRAEVRTQRRA